MSYNSFILRYWRSLRFAQDDKLGGGVICTVGRGLAPAVNSHRTLRRGQNSPNSGTLLSASQTFPLSGESPRPTDKPICIAKNLRGAESSPPTHALHFYFSIGTVKTVPYGCRGDSRIARCFRRLPLRGRNNGTTTQRPLQDVISDREDL